MAPRLATNRQFSDRGAGYRSSLPDTGNPLHKALAKAAPQSALVLEYLASGRGLSGLIAHTVLGVTSLTTRVAELRKQGIPIVGQWNTDHQNKRFMVYKYDPAALEPLDEPEDVYHGTDALEAEGGPVHPKAHLERPTHIHDDD
jgi:hypothetical protein